LEATERRTEIAAAQPLLSRQMPVKRFRIQGRVQGVGFRYFTRRTARSLGLNGFVRNLPDGSVEAVAEGDEDRLTALERELRRGPSGARVESVESSDHHSGSGAGDFEIR
jgi:acylphosphatase